VDRVVKRKHKVKKKKLITAILLLVLVSVLGIWGFLQIAENNEIRAANALIEQANALVRQAIEERTLAISEQELKFYSEEKSFVHSFADFLIYVDEELVAHFDADKLKEAVIKIHAQIDEFEVDKEAVFEDALRILSNQNVRNGASTQNEYLVILSEVWVPDETLIGKDLLGTFYTYFNAGQTGRNANLYRAAYLINNYIIQPNAIFNMTDNIGPINASNGYTIALVIRDGEFVEGMGGGVCQVSSTLYMAALFAELEIVQRRAHSRLVGYMPPAFDAVLSIPTLNLRFRNTTEHPVIIETIVDFRNSRLTANIWGTETRPEGRTISFNSVRVATTAEWWTYHLYKYVNYNGEVTRSRVNVSAYRVERADEITYEEAVGAEHEDEGTSDNEVEDDEYEDEIMHPEEIDTYQHQFENNN